MRPLPRQAVYLPFEAGPYRMAMDLVTVPEAVWFELDVRYPQEMTERRRLLDAAHAEVYGALPSSDQARTEALCLIVAALTAHHPDWFSQDGDLLRNNLLGETWHLATRTAIRQASSPLAQTEILEPRQSPGIRDAPLDSLELAGRLVQEDLCIIQEGANGPTFTAAILCFPSRWRLMDKLGHPLSMVHGPVPFYAERLSRPVDRFMRHVKHGHIGSRLNWSVLDDAMLFQPGGKWRVGTKTDITAQNAGDRLFLRVERQTLRRLPKSNAVLFGIRVHVYPLSEVIDRPARAATLSNAVRALPQEIAHYKSMLPLREALLGWLDGHRRVGDQPFITRPRSSSTT
jgi:hypothetical protein